MRIDLAEFTGSDSEIRYRCGSACYHVRVENPHGVETGVAAVELDGRPVEGGVPLVDDGREHAVRVVMGIGVAAAPPG